MSVSPREARAWAMAQPMIPAPMMTASAVVFTRLAPAYAAATGQVRRSPSASIGLWPTVPRVTIGLWRAGMQSLDGEIRAPAGGAPEPALLRQREDGHGCDDKRNRDRRVSRALLRQPRADVGELLLAGPPGAKMPVRFVDLPGDPL